MNPGRYFNFRPNVRAKCYFFPEDIGRIPVFLHRAFSPFYDSSFLLKIVQLPPWTFICYSGRPTPGSTSEFGLFLPIMTCVEAQIHRRQIMGWGKRSQPRKPPFPLNFFPPPITELSTIPHLPAPSFPYMQAGRSVKVLPPQLFTGMPRPRSLNPC